MNYQVHSKWDYFISQHCYSSADADHMCLSGTASKSYHIWEQK